MELKNCLIIEQQILEAAKKHIGEKGAQCNPKYSKHWWTKECKTAVVERKKALNIYKKDTGSITKFLILKEKQALARKTIRKAKANSWSQYL